MKKTISFIMAMMLTAGAFTACGEKDGSSSKDYKKECAKTMLNLMKAADDQDIDKMSSCMFPDKLTKLFKKMDSSDLTSELIPDDIFEDLDIDIDDLEIKVTDAEDADKDAIETLEVSYSVYYNMFELLDDAGYSFEDLSEGDIDEDDIDMDKLNALGSALYGGSTDDVDISIKIEDAKYVTFTCNDDELAENLEDEPVLMYKAKGDDSWKVDLIATSMMSYVEKSKESSAASEARSIYHAANAAIVDVDNMDYDISGTYVISSSKKKNVLASKDKKSIGGNLDEFMDIMKEYYEDLDDVDYFLISEDGTCWYVAVEINGSIGTYPRESVYAGDRGTESIDVSDYDLDELYDLCMDNID